MKNVFKSVLFMLVLVLSAAFVAAQPTVSSINDQTVNEGSLLRVPITVSATNNPADVFANLSVCQLQSQTGSCKTPYSNVSITVDSKTVANISTLTTISGEFNWTPDFTQANVYFFNVSANDADSVSIKTMKVTVVDVPPKLTTTATLELGSDIQERSDPNHDTR